MDPKNPDPKLVEEFFFEAASVTYASNTDKYRITTVYQFQKAYRYERGEFMYEDRYEVNGEFSYGQTVISANLMPAWVKQYNGWCSKKANTDKRITNFLKSTLAFAYSTRQFMAGRGFQQFKEANLGNDGLLAYENNFDPYHRDFSYFSTRERIYEYPAHTTELFWHRVWGMLLCGDVEKNTALIRA